jgi:hypothetical protein
MLTIFDSRWTLRRPYYRWILDSGKRLYVTSLYELHVRHILTSYTYRAMELLLRRYSSMSYPRFRDRELTSSGRGVLHHVTHLDVGDL